MRNFPTKHRHGQEDKAMEQPRKRPTKISLIRKHLESGRPITPLSALRLYNSFALKDIICSLRGRGLNIRTDIVENEETGAKFGKYSLIKPKSE